MIDEDREGGGLDLSVVVRRMRRTALGMQDGGDAGM